MAAFSKKARLCLFYWMTNLLIFLFCYLGAVPVGLIGAKPHSSVLPVGPTEPQIPEQQEQTEVGKTELPELLPAPLSKALSSSEEALVLQAPAKMQMTVEYMTGEPYTKEMTKEEIQDAVEALQNAPRVKKDAKVTAATPSNTVAVQLYYTEGYGSLYLFCGYIDQSKKPVTIIQDSDNHLYQARQDVCREFFERARPHITEIAADKVNIYSAVHFRKQSLQAQLVEEEEWTFVVELLNSLEQAGGGTHMEKPDYVIAMVAPGKAEEKDSWFVWLDGKYPVLVQAEDNSTAYLSKGITSREFKKMVKKYNVK